MRRLFFCFTLLVGISALGTLLLPARQTHGRKDTKTEAKTAPSLAKQIRHQLLAAPYYSVFDAISFSLSGSKVTLAGQVVRPTLKADAEAAIRSIEGVDSVINQIEVLPASPSDDELRRSLYRSIYEDSSLAGYAVQPIPPMHIIVKNGTVSLEGGVNNLADKNLATARANAVANVLSFKNNLVVQPKGSAAE